MRRFLTFWQIDLVNLPVGCFERRTITPKAAQAMIVAARAANTLTCLTSVDLLAPYKARERRRTEELCDILTAEFAIPIQIRDFLAADQDDDGRSLWFSIPLQATQLQPGEALLVIGCSYGLVSDAQTEDVDRRLVIDPQTVSFDLITALLGDTVSQHPPAEHTSDL